MSGVSNRLLCVLLLVNNVLESKDQLIRKMELQTPRRGRLQPRTRCSQNSHIGITGPSILFLTLQQGRSRGKNQQRRRN